MLIESRGPVSKVTLTWVQGVPKQVVQHTWPQRQANTPATPMGFVMEYCGAGGTSGGPCGRQAHCASHPIVETIFDLATRDLPAAGMDPDSAWQLVERLWYSSRVGSGHATVHTVSLIESVPIGRIGGARHGRVVG